MVEGKEESASSACCGGLFPRLRQLLGLISKEKALAAPADEDVKPCCDGVVHVAYRGLSDDRLYLAYKRRWTEVKFFRQNGLRVFCAGCRRRLI